MRKLAFSVLRIAGALYALITLGLLFWQEAFLFHPSVLPKGYDFDLPRGEEETWVADLHGVFIPGEPLILYFHGNAGDLAGWSGVAREIAQRTHHGVWIFDYPGFGESPGRVGSEAQLHAAANAMFKASVARTGRAPILYGRSIGTGLAVKLASEHADVPALILESPYFSLRDLVASQFWWVPTFLLRYPLRSDEWMPAVHARTLILHGGRDTLIPPEQGRRLAALAHGARFEEIGDGEHNDLADHPAYWRALGEFLGVTRETR